MSLRDKQLKEKNTLACIIGSIIAITMTVTDILGLLGSNAGVKQIIHLCIIAPVLITIILGLKLVKNPERYKHLCSVAIFVLYAATLATAIVYTVYIYAFPIAILIAVFSDKKLAIRGACLACISHSIFTFIAVSTYGDSFINEVILGTCTVFTASIAMVIYVMQIDKHTSESMIQIEEQLRKQEGMTAKIAEDTKNLISEFHNSHDIAKVLTDNINGNSIAIHEVADSTKLTAEAIEKQTAQTVEIQSSIESVQAKAREMAVISESTKQSVEEGVEVINQLKY